MLIKQHAIEMALHGITVNGVAPTFVHTETIRYITEEPAYRDKLISRNSMGRIADPKDVVGPVLMFAARAWGRIAAEIRSRGHLPVTVNAMDSGRSVLTG